MDELEYIDNELYFVAVQLDESDSYVQSYTYCKKNLKKNKINVTIRREFGSKVNAACGQLRSNYEEGR